MSRPLRTNPAFAHLAYRKTIINRMIVFLRRNYLGDELSEPKEILICEDVLPVDSHTPQEEIQHYMESLTAESAEIEVELSKFQFMPTTRGQNDQQQKSQKGPRKPQPKGQQFGGKGGRPS